METLNAEQRTRLLAAQARRMRLAHYQQLQHLVATPDYYAHMERATGRWRDAPGYQSTRVHAWGRVAR